MCLSNAKFSMKPEDGKFVGVGYKALYTNQIDIMGTGWKKATGISSYDSLRRIPDYNANVLTDDAASRYFPGFHIFLNAKHALAYGALNKATYHTRTCRLVRVKYRNVVAFGQNNAAGTKGDCVIALEMKVDKVYSKEELPNRR